MTPDMFGMPAARPAAGPKILRTDQEQGIAMARERIANAKRSGRPARVILMASVGWGKTIAAAAIVRSAAAKGTRVLFIVDAISLIDQTVDVFYAEGINSIGVIQADHPMTDASKLVQIASVQTLQKRPMPPVDLIIIDEAHCQYEFINKLLRSETYAHVPVLGLSATPWSKGLGNVYSDLVRPISMQQLIDRGHLSQFRVFASSHPDLTGVKTVAGEYHEGQLADVMGEGQLVADVVDTYRRLGDNRPALCFAVDRAHAKKLQRRFEEAGIGCGYIDAYTDARERKAIRRQLDAGEIKVVCNIGCLTKGVDWALGCIILARPTKSEMLYVQMVGRGLRVNDGIPDCVILDHADNTLRMGFVTDLSDSKTVLCTAKKGERKKQERDTPLPKECPKCQYLKPAKVGLCPQCGFLPERQSDIEEADGELVEVTPRKIKATMQEKQAWLSGLNWIARERGYKSGWVSNTYKKKFGVWPNQLNRNASVQPTQEVRNYVLGLNIRFAKGKGRHAA